MHSGIDYLGLLDAQHTRDAAGKVNYSALLGEQQPADLDEDQPADTGEYDIDEQDGQRA